MSEEHKNQIIKPIVSAIEKRQERINEQLAASVVNQVSMAAQQVGELITSAPLDADHVIVRDIDVSILSILANVGIDIVIDAGSKTGRIALPTARAATVATPRQPTRQQVAPGAPKKRHFAQVDGELAPPPEATVRRINLDDSPTVTIAQQRVADAAQRVANNPSDHTAIEELCAATSELKPEGEK